MLQYKNRDRRKLLTAWVNSSTHAGKLSSRWQQSKGTDHKVGISQIPRLVPRSLCGHGSEPAAGQQRKFGPWNQSSGSQPFIIIIIAFVLTPGIYISPVQYHLVMAFGSFSSRCITLSFMETDKVLQLTTMSTCIWYEHSRANRLPIRSGGLTGLLVLVFAFHY